MTVVLGLTGGIASGKSTVSHMIRELGIQVIDADIISRKVVEIGKPAYSQIVEEFGKDILEADQTINRAQLGSVIFADEKKRHLLNEIVHPAVRKEMLSQVEIEKQKQKKAVVLDIPLLFESELTYLVDKTILVYVDENIQLMRLMKRNDFTVDEAKMRIRSQMPLKDKIQLSDHLINNNGTIEETKAQLQAILKILVQ